LKWITRERPKIDRLACPWLIKRFADAEAEFIYAPYSDVLKIAGDTGAIPFDIPNVEYTHYEDQCTFDYIIKRHGITDKAVKVIANIVRGADTDRHDIAPEAAGLWAISAGLAYNIEDDYKLLDVGMLIYDALYNWATHLYDHRHLQNSPFENLLHTVFQKMKAETPEKKKAPQWVADLKNIIQDQIDTQFVFDLKKISGELEINPSYLSREFSKYFDNLSFGDYIRKLRIKKAKQLIEISGYTFTEIAYLTGFSDQSHFTRVFRNFTGENPSVYKKKILKSKEDTKGK
jgi:AraC-like DNA-binding protein